MDSSFTLVEERRGGGRAKLNRIGRDIEYRELELRRNADNVWEVTTDSYQQPELVDGRVVFLLCALMDSRREFIGTPTELANKIDPDGSEGITPQKVGRQIQKSIDALWKAGITASIRRSNGKRLIELRRADSAGFAGAGEIDPIDPVGNGEARCAAQ